jgi:hypothetical protein
LQEIGQDVNISCCMPTRYGVYQPGNRIQRQKEN